jgi:orotidine-5'-phosphate decarboxylase
MSAARFQNPVFVAIDTPDLNRALALARTLKPHVGGLKVGLEFLTAQGPEGVRRIVEIGLPVFADTKFHDIPNTVAGAAREIAKLGVAIFNVHASGGAAMMRAGLEAARAVSPHTQVIGVTVLTSVDDGDLDAIGQRGPLSDQVVRLARLAKQAGLDGVVCAAREIAAVRKACGLDFLIVVPGIRPAGAELGDQRRVMTPGEAHRAGAGILVVGRPITAAADPALAAQAIVAELAGTMA